MDNNQKIKLILQDMEEGAVELTLKIPEFQRKLARATELLTMILTTEQASMLMQRSQQLEQQSKEARELAHKYMGVMSAAMIRVSEINTRGLGGKAKST